MSNEELVKEIQTGENGRLADLYLCNKGFIYMMARKYRGMAEEEDLMQEGYIGLQVAAERFDAALGVPFISYAADWIRQGMQRCVNSTGSIRIPEHTLNDLRKYRKIYTEITSCTGREPNDEEVAAAMGISMERIVDIKAAGYIKTVSSLDERISDDEDLTLSDTVSDGKDIAESFAEKEAEKERKEAVWAAVDSLEEMQAEVIKLRFRSKMTFQEAADNIGITMHEARKAQKMGLEKLRRNKQLRQQCSISDFIDTKAYKGGLAAFKHTFTSSTERTALELYEMVERMIVVKPDKT